MYLCHLWSFLSLTKNANFHLWKVNPRKNKQSTSLIKYHHLIRNFLFLRFCRRSFWRFLNNWDFFVGFSVHQSQQEIRSSGGFFALWITTHSFAGRNWLALTTCGSLHLASFNSVWKMGKSKKKLRLLKLFGSISNFGGVNTRKHTTPEHRKKFLWVTLTAISAKVSIISAKGLFKRITVSVLWSENFFSWQLIRRTL